MKISSRTQDHVMLFTTYKNKVTMTWDHSIKIWNQGPRDTPHHLQKIRW
jgi:hypothetical protein